MAPVLASGSSHSRIRHHSSERRLKNRRWPVLSVPGVLLRTSMARTWALTWFWRMSNGEEPTPITSMWMGARSRRASMVWVATDWPSRRLGPRDRHGLVEPHPMAPGDHGLVPAAAGHVHPHAVHLAMLLARMGLGPALPAATARSTQRVGITCHASSVMPALKSPLSI
jgi:hypothetical protein